jgi:murein DD-endopeptidase MepM/ murein hydrolase activator NlpD
LFFVILVVFVAQASGNQGIFGKRAEPHMIIIAQGDRIRHYTVKPWIMAAAGTVAVAFAAGYLMATSYLVFRDDLIGASIARQARMQHSYEDRISALRSQVDRIISRQLLDQELMEQKVAQLMDRQNALFERNSKLGPLLERADGAKMSDEAPIPTKRPDSSKSASLLDTFKTGSISSTGTGYKDADLADEAFMSINGSLKNIEASQINRLKGLVIEANETGNKIVRTLESAGLDMDAKPTTDDMGGPFIPADAANGFDQAFDETVNQLDNALSRLDTIRSEAAGYPIKAPVPGQDVTSTFGYRTDPLLGTKAFHSGMDFRGPTGLAVKASAAGTVIHAGVSGGYGNMVEIKHASGWTARYGHLSQIRVQEGDKIEAGQTIGAVGSTGRSTGPHLHFEVRKNDEAHDPAPFLRTGRKVADLL